MAEWAAAALQVCCETPAITRLCLFLLFPTLILPAVLAPLLSAVVLLPLLLLSQSPPSTWCCVCVVASLSPHCRSWPASTTRTR